MDSTIDSVGDLGWARWCCAAWLVAACGPVGGDDGDGTGGSESGSQSSEATSSTQTSASSGSSSTADSSSDDGSTTAGGCATPVPDEQIDIIEIGAGIFDKAPVGGELQLQIVSYLGSGFPEPIATCVEWSLAPADGASISADGLLAIDAATAPGTVFTVTADVEDGRRVLMVDIEAYVPVDADIVRTWSEVSRIQCDTGDTIPAEPVINEVVFFETGDFWVTWQPFETYVDYWGTFTYDQGSGALEMTVGGGNYVPPDVDPSGTAMVIDGEVAQLVLQDMWLGTDQQGEGAEVACGHVFE